MGWISAADNNSARTSGSTPRLVLCWRNLAPVRSEARPLLKSGDTFKRAHRLLQYAATEVCKSTSRRSKAQHGVCVCLADHWVFFACRDVWQLASRSYRLFSTVRTPIRGWEPWRDAVCPNVMVSVTAGGVPRTSPPRSVSTCIEGRLYIFMSSVHPSFAEREHTPHHRMAPSAQPSPP
jgi:hypothetical protein